jgi:hypothetical protein
MELVKVDVVTVDQYVKENADKKTDGSRPIAR